MWALVYVRSKSDVVFEPSQATSAPLVLGADKAGFFPGAWHCG